MSPEDRIEQIWQILGNDRTLTIGQREELTNELDELENRQP
jgi:hypothetical protein